MRRASVTGDRPMRAVPLVQAWPELQTAARAWLGLRRVARVSAAKQRHQLHHSGPPALLRSAPIGRPAPFGAAPSPSAGAAGESFANHGKGRATTAGTAS